MEKKIPTLHAIIRWCNLIIDSHLTMLVLVDECNEALTILNQATLNYLEIIDHMAALEGMSLVIFRNNNFTHFSVGCVQHLVLQSPLPEQKEIADYSVEHFVWTDRSQFMPKKKYSDLPKKTKRKSISKKKRSFKTGSKGKSKEQKKIHKSLKGEVRRSKKSRTSEKL